MGDLKVPGRYGEWYTTMVMGKAKCMISIDITDMFLTSGRPMKHATVEPVLFINNVTKIQSCVRNSYLSIYRDFFSKSE